MKRRVSTLAVTVLLAFFATIAYADCTAPSQPGAVICFPSPNSTFSYPMNVEAAATGQNDSPIVKMILYADNKKVYETDNSNTLTDPYDDSVEYNGSHHLVLNAWDAQGHLFQFSEYVKLINGAVPQCQAPQTGIAICSPLNGSYNPESNVQVIASGSSTIVGYDVYENGMYFDHFDGRNLDVLTGFWPVTNKPIALTLKAKDSAGHTYTQTTNFYQYYASYVCGKTSCNPGIFVTSPEDHQDVQSGFRLNAQVQYNTASITAMKAYLDGKIVATSTGPSIYSTVDASRGTHLLTIQAWDTTGALYKIDMTVNAQ